MNLHRIKDTIFDQTLNSFLKSQYFLLKIYVKIQILITFNLLNQINQR